MFQKANPKERTLDRLKSVKKLFLIQIENIYMDLAAGFLHFQTSFFKGSQRRLSEFPYSKGETDGWTDYHGYCSTEELLSNLI